MPIARTVQSRWRADIVPAVRVVSRAPSAEGLRSGSRWLDGSPVGWTCRHIFRSPRDLSVNSVCHTFGRRAYKPTDQSRNQWSVGLRAMGEGWHNNHHAFPRSAVHGLDARQLNVSAWMITALERLILINEVQRVTPEARARKRLAS